ncbi:MAG TPA: nuclear transport factor 2 family protein [Steroidobacteraceae bacterium]|nr:nuclear transport factor 2 family protein [Steroidobacteraceae bacterium]
MRKSMLFTLLACVIAVAGCDRQPAAQAAPEAGAAAATNAAPAPAARPAPGMSVSGKPLAPLTVAADQHALLASNDPKLARNKKHVYDFWRIVYEAGHMERAAEFMAPEYIQHNPNVESGRDAFVATMSRARPKREVEPVSRFPIIDIIAERDIVMVMWARKVRDREHPEEIYEMTWFDVFRVDDATGLISEHWDSSERWGSAGRPPGAEFFP